jgi:hypothetical protein
MKTIVPEEEHFSTTLPIIIYCRPKGQTSIEWKELDRGPGFFTIPKDQETMLRIRQMDDADFRQLIKDISGCSRIISLDLSENRKITDESLEYLQEIPQIESLNLSSCDISNKGLVHLTDLPHLTHLNLSYCNRLSDNGIHHIKEMRHLVFLDLLGVIKVSNSGFVMIRRKGLSIRR